MSALGHKQTLADVHPMSALPLCQKQTSRDATTVPKAAIARG
jgi:hypothetical protein